MDAQTQIETAATGTTDIIDGFPVTEIRNHIIRDPFAKIILLGIETGDMETVQNWLKVKKEEGGIAVQPINPEVLKRHAEEKKCHIINNYHIPDENQRRNQPWENALLTEFPFASKGNLLILYDSSLSLQEALPLIGAEYMRLISPQLEQEFEGEPLWPKGMGRAATTFFSEFAQKETLTTDQIVETVKAQRLVGDDLGILYTRMRQELWRAIRQRNWTDFDSEEDSKKRQELTIEDVIHQRYLAHLATIWDNQIRQGKWQTNLFKNWARQPNFCLEVDPFQPLPKEIGRYFFQDFIEELFNPEFRPFTLEEGQAASLVEYLNHYYQPLGVKIAYGSERLPFTGDYDRLKNQRSDFLWELALKNMGFQVAEYVSNYLRDHDQIGDGCQLLEINFPQVIDNWKIPYLQFTKNGKVVKYYLFALRSMVGDFHQHSAMYINNRKEEDAFSKVNFNYAVLGLRSLFPFPTGLFGIVHEIDHMVRDIIEEGKIAPSEDIDYRIISEGSAEETGYNFLETQAKGHGDVWPEVFKYLAVRERWKTETDRAVRNYRYGYRYNVGGLIATATRILLGFAEYFKLFYHPNRSKIGKKLDLPKLKSELSDLLCQVDSQ